MVGEFAQRYEALLAGNPLGMIDYTAQGITKPHFATDGHTPLDFRDAQNMGLTMGWIALVLRLVGMSVVVPMFEELFVRSLMLRSLSHGRKTWLGGGA